MKKIILLSLIISGLLSCKKNGNSTKTNTTNTTNTQINKLNKIWKYAEFSSDGGITFTPALDKSTQEYLSNGTYIYSNACFSYPSLKMKYILNGDTLYVDGEKRFIKKLTDSIFWFTANGYESHFVAIKVPIFKTDHIYISKSPLATKLCKTWVLDSICGGICKKPNTIEEITYNLNDTLSTYSSAGSQTYLYSYQLIGDTVIRASYVTNPYVPGLDYHIRTLNDSVMILELYYCFSLTGTGTYYKYKVK